MIIDATEQHFDFKNEKVKNQQKTFFSDFDNVSYKYSSYHLSK